MRQRLSLGLWSLAAALVLHPPAQAGWDLADILIPRMLGATLATLEENAGQPVEVHALPDGQQVRLYDVRNCNMVAYLRDGRVQSFELPLDLVQAGHCTMQLGPFLGVTLPAADRLTLGDFTRAVGLPADVGRRSFGMSCLNIRDCEGPGEPTAELFWRGSQGLEVRLSIAATFGEEGIRLPNIPALAAANAWERTMQGEGRDYIVNARFNCDDRHQGDGIRLFAAAPISEIRIGRGLGDGQSYADRCR